MSIMCATLSKKLIFFALREKESREVEIFTSASVWYFPGKETCTVTYIFATLFYMCVCLKKNCTSQTCLSDLSYKCQDRSTFDALSPGEGPLWPGPIKCFCAPGIKFDQKVPPKKRVIATKLNLQQKCAFHLFYRFSFPFIIFLCFPSFFIVFSTFFIVLLCFSSFLIIPNLFPFRTETLREAIL